MQKILHYLQGLTITELFGVFMVVCMVVATPFLIRECVIGFKKYKKQQKGIKEAEERKQKLTQLILGLAEKQKKTMKDPDLLKTWQILVNIISSALFDITSSISRGYGNMGSFDINDINSSIKLIESNIFDDSHQLGEEAHIFIGVNNKVYVCEVQNEAGCEASKMLKELKKLKKEVLKKLKVSS